MDTHLLLVGLQKIGAWRGKPRESPVAAALLRQATGIMKCETPCSDRETTLLAVCCAAHVLGPAHHLRKVGDVCMCVVTCSTKKNVPGMFVQEMLSRFLP